MTPYFKGTQLLKLSKTFNDAERRAACLQQLNFLCIAGIQRLLLQSQYITHIFFVHCYGLAKFFKAWIWRSRFHSYLPVCADMTAKYPKFDGAGYIAFPVLRSAHRELHMTVELRPDALDGLVLFSAAHPDAQSDFFSLSLQRGRIELRYRLFRSHHPRG